MCFSPAPAPPRPAVGDTFVCTRTFTRKGKKFSAAPELPEPEDLEPLPRPGADKGARRLGWGRAALAGGEAEGLWEGGRDAPLGSAAEQRSCVYRSLAFQQKDALARLLSRSLARLPAVIELAPRLTAHRPLAWP